MRPCKCGARDFGNRSCTFSGQLNLIEKRIIVEIPICIQFGKLFEPRNDARAVLTSRIFTSLKVQSSGEILHVSKPSKDSYTQPSPADPPRKRPVSERRIQANRRNALRSTGPRTARGKRTVARNAIKHGFLAREVVITAGDGAESLEEFHTLIGNLWECYEPEGVVEESLVQTIATCLWRKARVIRAENGEIRKRLDTLAVDRALRISDKGNLDVALSHMELGLFNAENPADGEVSTRERWSVLQGAQSDMRGHHSGLAYLSALLETAKSEITSGGHISGRTAHRIFSVFGLWDCLLGLTCLYSGRSETKVETTPSAGAGDKEVENGRASLIAVIDSRLERLSLYERYATEREKLTEGAEARSFSLPPAVATDKILRYEAHLDRQLYRAMDQLERLQRRRRGDDVPPPLNISLYRRSSPQPR